MSVGAISDRIDASRDFQDWFEILTTNAPTSGTFEVFDSDAAAFERGE